MKHEVGDTVRIRSKAWIDAQKKDEFGRILCGELDMIPEMFVYAGDRVIIKSMNSDGSAYRIDIDRGMWSWTDEMFENDSYIEALQKRVADLEAEVAVLKGEKIVYDRIVYDRNKHYVGIWENCPYILKSIAASAYGFCGMERTYTYLASLASSGQEAIDIAIKETNASGIPISIHVFDTGKEALEFMLKYL